MFCLFLFSFRNLIFSYSIALDLILCSAEFLLSSNTLKCNHLLSLKHSKPSYYPVFEKQAVCSPSLPSQQIWNWTLEGLTPPGPTGETQRRQIDVELRQQLQFFFVFFVAGLERSEAIRVKGTTRRTEEETVGIVLLWTLYYVTSIHYTPADPSGPPTWEQMYSSTWKTPEDDTSHSGGGVLNTSDTSGETPQRLNEHVEVKKW